MTPLGWLGRKISTQTNPAFANSVDPDRLASVEANRTEANRSGSALFVIQYVNLYKNLD